jgi:PAS domain S-box-containing protein
VTAEYAQSFVRLLAPALNGDTGQRARRYAVGALAGAAGVAIIFLLEWLTDDLLLTPSIVAVLVAAWFGGLGPGLLALGIIVAVTPFFTFVPNDAHHVVSEYLTRVLVVVPAAGVTAVLGQQGRRAVFSLRRSQHLFDAFMGNLPGAAWMKDVEGRYVYANDEAVRVFRTSRDELYGKDDAEVFPALTAQQFIENDHLALSRRDSVQTVEALEHEDGLHQSLVVKFPVLDRQLDPEFVGGVAIDITDRHHAEQELAQRSEQLQLVIDTVPALVSFVDTERRYVFNSQMYEDWFGVPSAGMQGRTVEDVVGADAFALIRPYMERALAGEVIEYEAQLPYRDGGSRWVEAKYVPHRDRAGQVDGFFSLVLDVSARKNLERERALLSEITEHLSRSLDVEETVRGLLTALVPSFADGAAVYFTDGDEDAHGIVMTEAGAALESRGYVIDRDAARGVAAVMHSGRAEHYRQAPPDLRLPVAVDAEGTPDEDPQHTSAMFAPVVADNRIVAVLAVWTAAGGRVCEAHDFDVLKEIARRAGLAVQQSLLYEETRRIAEQLQVANNAKDEFLGTVSHELRTPITVILGNASLLANRHQQMDSETVTASLGDLLGQAERLHRVVENMLILAQLERSAGADMEPILLARSISQVIAEAQRQQPGRVIRLESSDWDLFALGVESYVHQVLLNYMNNAMRYSPPDEPVDISVQLAGDDVEVRVLDRGVGLTDEDTEALFEPFYRSERVPAEARGIGIGLSVSKRLIDAVGGRVWAHPRDGGGAEFGFALRTVAGRDPGERDLPPPGAASDGVGAQPAGPHNE